MLGSNPSADSVALTDRGGCFGIPRALFAGKNFHEESIGEAPKR